MAGGWGGKRPGAGRPRLPKGKAAVKMLCFRVPSWLQRRLKAEARRRGVSVTALLLGPWREKR
jgi:hypothetical protein